MHVSSVRAGRTCLLALLAGSLCLRPSADAADLSARWTWKPVRIGAGGWMRGMVINPQHPNIRFARGDVDNAYRWDGANNAWVPMKIASALPGKVVAAPAAAGGSALAYDPSNVNVVLCAYSFQRSSDITGTYPNVAFNIYRSTDGGKTFTAGNLSLSGDTVNEEQGERLAIDPNNGKIIYLGTPSNGLYRSMDGGLTWGGVSDGPGAARFPRFDAGAGTARLGGQTVSKRVYCTTTGGSVYRSDDGGGTWNSISAGQGVDGRPGFTTVDQDGNLWVAQDSGKAGSATIYEYTRAGAWSSHATPHGPVDGIAVDPRDVKRVFVMTAGGSLARSNDGGKTWTDLGANLHYSSTQTVQWLRPSAIRPDGHYESTSNLYMDENGDLWMSGGNDGVLTCTPNDRADSASNPPVWSSASAGIEEMVAQSCVLPPGGSPVLTVEDETCFTIQNPDTFNALHFNLNLWDGNNGLSSAQDVNYCPNQPKFVVCTTANVFTANPASANYAAYSADGGRNWVRFGSIIAGKNPAPLYAGVIAVSARRTGHQDDTHGGDNIVWIGSNIYSQNSPAPFYSTDGGRTWTQTQSFNSAPGAFVDNGYEYMGKQWGPWNPSLKVHSLEADPLTPGVFYANLAAGGFWKSTDGGKTWSQPAGAAQLPGLAHHGQLKANIYASGDLWFVDGYEGASAHGLWHTTDGGNSFTKIGGLDYCWALALGKARRPGGYPTVYVYGKQAGNSRWGIFASFDRGRTWNQVSGYPTGLIDVPSSMAASWDTFGTVYIGFRGNSYVYGTYNAPSGVIPPPQGRRNAAGGRGARAGAGRGHPRARESSAPQRRRASQASGLPDTEPRGV